MYFFINEDTMLSLQRSRLYCAVLARCLSIKLPEMKILLLDQTKLIHSVNPQENLKG